MEAKIFLICSALILSLIVSFLPQPNPILTRVLEWIVLTIDGRRDTPSDKDNTDSTRQELEKLLEEENATDGLPPISDGFPENIPPDWKPILP